MNFCSFSTDTPTFVGKSCSRNISRVKCTRSSDENARASMSIDRSNCPTRFDMGVQELRARNQGDRCLRRSEAEIFHQTKRTTAASVELHVFPLIPATPHCRYSTLLPLSMTVPIELDKDWVARGHDTDLFATLKSLFITFWPGTNCRREARASHRDLRSPWSPLRSPHACRRPNDLSNEMVHESWLFS